MRRTILFALFLAAALQLSTQTAPTTPSALPKDPREILSMAAPYYNFSDPALKPWHLKATYQLYDEKGKPTEQGTYEYWWASPKVYRTTWIRPGASQNHWQTADGKEAYESSGEALTFFENKLQSALFSPLPGARDLDPAKFRLSREEVKLGDAKFPCVEAIPLMPQHGQVQNVPLGLFPTYCFDPNVPALRVSYSFGSIAIYFNRVVRVQGHFLPREIEFHEGKQQILSAEVQTIEGISPANSAFTPTAKAIYPKLDRVQLSPGITVGMLVQKKQPVYPQDAKDAHASGTVVLQATIGREGRIHDLRVISAPWPSLAAAALGAVSQWEYKPYLLNGEPVEVETTVNVIFTLGG